MHVIGQTKIKQYLDLSIDIPKIMMLIGQKGQGKRTIAKYVSELMGCRIYVPKQLKVDDMREMIEDAYTLYEKTIYLIADADTLTIQAQNALLKFIEEPPQNAHIIFTVDHPDSLLPTIQSRAQSFILEQYTKKELQEVSDNELLSSIFHNIGQIERAKDYDIAALLKTATTVVDNISAISTANTFNILKHFEIEDADLFLTLLLHVYHLRLTTAGEVTFEKMLLKNQLREVYKCKNQLSNKSLNKQNALEMMFVRMREAKK